MSYIGLGVFVVGGVGELHADKVDGEGLLGKGHDGGDAGEGDDELHVALIRLGNSSMRSVAKFIRWERGPRRGQR